MKTLLWQRFDVMARRMVPVGLTLGLVLISVVPLPVPGFAAIAPMLALASVFFWAIHNPGLMPPWTVFLLGLVHDILSGALLGSGTVVLLLAYGAMVAQRRFFLHKSFAVVWWGFIMLAIAAGFIAWLIACVFSATLVSPRSVAFQVLMTIAIYPVATWLFHMAQRLLPQES